MVRGAGLHPSDPGLRVPDPRNQGPTGMAVGPSWGRRHQGRFSKMDTDRPVRPCLPRREAAVDDEHGPGNPPGGVRTEIQGRQGDVDGFAEAA